MGIHEFDSVRKRMSVIVQCPDQAIRLLVKGADSTVLGIVGSGENENSAERGESVAEVQHRSKVAVETLGHLDRYARDGLRTLVVASRELTQKEVQIDPFFKIGVVMENVVWFKCKRHIWLELPSGHKN